MPSLTADRSPRHRVVRVLEILGVALLYVGAGRAGLLQGLVRGQVTPLWPPTGISLAALLLFGPGIWPGIALGAFLVNIPLGPSVPAVLAITVGNTLAPLSSYVLLRRAGFRTQLDRLRDAVALVFLGALAGMLVSATIGTGALGLSGALPVRGFWSTWSVWWTGDAMGVLVITPVLLVLSAARRPRNVPWTRWAEAAALLLVLVLASAVAASAPSRLFVVFPVVIWAAFRFRLAGAALTALAASTSAILAASNRWGAFVHATPPHDHSLLNDMITLQAFNGSVALTALLLAAAINERDRTHEEILRLCEQLSGTVSRIAPGEGGGRPPPPPDRSGE